MIDAFFGEFLLHPIPLEMSGNTCSHNCCYCFANIRRCNRVSEISRVVKFLKGDSKVQNLASVLYREGFPICISNRSDPFSESNYGETRIMAKILSEKQNGLFIQTKFGREEYVDEFIEILGNKKDVIFYVTITTPDDAIAKIIEPGAPPPSVRKQIALRLVKRGYPVIIAFNPYVEGWTNLEENLNECVYFSKHGINNFVYQRLHLTTADIKMMDKSMLNRLKKTGIDIEPYTKKNTRIEIQKKAQAAVIQTYKAGYNSILWGMPFKTDFFNIFEKTYKKCFPSNYKFYNWAIKNKKPEEIITKNEYINSLEKSFGKLLDAPLKGIDTYILRMSRAVWKGNMRAQNLRTYRDLLGIIYDDSRISACPKNNILMKTNEKNELVFNGIVNP